MNLWRILGIDQDDPSARSRFGQLFDEVSHLLADRSDEEVKLVTGYAGLLGATADADDEFTPAEADRIAAILKNDLHLTDLQVTPIITLLRDHRLQLLALERHIYARLVHEVASREQKQELLRALFRVAAVDRSINAKEDSVLWMLADALNLSHREFVTIRAEFSRDREVFKDGSGSKT